MWEALGTENDKALPEPVPDDPQARPPSTRGPPSPSMPLFDIVVRSSAAAVAAGCSLEGVRDADGTWLRFADSPSPDALTVAVAEGVADTGGWMVALQGRAWAHAYDLGPGHAGAGRALAVVSAGEEPTKSGVQMLRLMFAALRAEMAKQAARRLAARRPPSTTAAAPAPTIRAVRELERLLHEPLVEGQGVEGVLEMLARLVGRPALAVDAQGDLLAAARRPGQDAPPPFDADQLPEPSAKGVHRVGEWWATAARIRDRVVAWVGLCDPDGDLSMVDTVALESAADAVAIELSGNRPGGLRSDDDWHVLCDALIAGKEVVARDVAAVVGYPLEAARRVVLVEAESHGAHFVEAVRRGVRPMQLFPVVSSQDGRVAFVAPDRVDWTGFRQSVFEEAGGRRCRVGVGGNAQEVESLKRSLHEADMSLRIGGMLDLGPVTLYDDLGVYALVVSSSDPGALSVFVDKWLGALVDYDRRGRMELVKTLGHYLEQGGSLDKTAASLCVHRSTLKYRLRRVREIGDLDLDDPDVRFNLQFATRARVTLEALRRDDYDEFTDHAGSGA